MEEQAAVPNGTVAVGTAVVTFEQVVKGALNFKVLGAVKDHYEHGYGDPPSYIQKDEIVTLITGKFPLDDYKDCNVHTYTFEKGDGTRFSGRLDGFTYDCTHEGMKHDIGSARFTVHLSADRS